MINEYKQFFLNEYRHIYFKYNLAFEIDYHHARCHKLQGKLCELEHIMFKLFGNSLSEEIFKIQVEVEKKVAEHMAKNNL